MLYSRQAEKRKRQVLIAYDMMGRKGMIIMKSTMIGYILGSNSITVSYDAGNKKFLVEEKYKDRDIGITMRFNYSVKSKGEVKESLNRFKKSFNK